MVVANLALAIAEGGTRVLAVDANTGEGGLTGRLLPGVPVDGGLEQVLAGQGTAAALRPAQPAQRRGRRARVRSAAAAAGDGRGPLEGGVCAAGDGEIKFRRRADRQPGFAEGCRRHRAGRASDAAIIVLSSNELIRDHVEMVDRLKLIGSDVVGCIYYNGAPMPPQLARYQRNGSSAHPMDPKVPLPTLSGGQPSNGGSGPSSEPPHR